MTDVKISQLPAATSSTGPDLLVIVQGGATKQITNTNLFTSTALTTPVLGTPTSGTLTNCTGLPIVNGTTGTLSVARGGTGTTTSTGTGSTVLSSSPALVTPDIGTPSAGILTNCSGLPVSTGLSGLGSNVATFLATPSSANLALAVTDETGSGALVFGTSPSLTTATLTTPTIYAGYASKTASFSLAATENYVVCNGASANVTVTLPAASGVTGRVVNLKNLSGTYTVISASSNVVPLAGGAAGTAILAATAGKWATLISNGTNWEIMAAN